MNINLVSLWDEIKDKKIVVYDLETTGFKSIVFSNQVSG